MKKMEGGREEDREKVPMMMKRKGRGKKRGGKKRGGRSRY